MAVVVAATYPGGAGQGGGYSGVMRGSAELIIAAGGGGGGGGDQASGHEAGAGGAGGGAKGDNGGNSTSAKGGKGATAGAGGAAGGGNATAGAALAGGNGGVDTIFGAGGGAGGSGGTNAGGNGGSGTTGRGGGGGGGAGHYGGGGGESATLATNSGSGGGGGSSYTTGTAASTVAGSNQDAGNESDPDYADNAGDGGTSGSSEQRGGPGIKGRVVITHSGAASYTITATSGPNGSISPAGAINVPAGNSRTFTISPSANCTILRVLVDGISIGAVASYTFTNVSADHTIDVTFEPPNEYTIQTSAGSHGSFSPPGPVSVAAGGTQSFSIRPDVGYTVDRVLVDGVSVGALSSYLFTNVNADHTIAAQFVLDTPPPDPSACLNISDIPLEVRRLSAPPNIMILFDDSGSMDAEALIPGFGGYGASYVFDNPCGENGPQGCHEQGGAPILGRGSDRLAWNTQWFEYNKMYYNPAITYEPWPTATGQFDNAYPDFPRSYALLETPTFDLSASYDTTSITSGEVIADDENQAVFSKTGPWSAATDVQAYTSNYYHTSENNSDVTATWSPYLLAGQYEVFARYVNDANRSTNVPYTITHAGGATTVNVNQQEHGGEWVTLGTYNFVTGNANVTISFHVNSNNQNRVCADAVKFVPAGSIPVDIKNAHYYVWSGQTSTPYLVIIDGGVISYYRVNDLNSDGQVDPGELVLTATPPADVVTGRTYVEERQNFANWFTFFRRRIFAAQYAVGKLIKNMQGVRIGIYTINQNLVQPVLPIKVKGLDESATLFSRLYDLQASGMTPLQTGLEAVGRYFDKGDDVKLDGSPGDDSPWDSDADGGSCQQAFTIIITDGYYNGAGPSDAIGNDDGDNGPPYADSYSKTLADVAMYFYERDLNTTLNNNLPINPYDDATHQHMVTYAIGFGVSGTLNPNDYDATLKHKLSGDSIVWPDAQESDVTKIDDFWHAAVNGRGKYLTATNPAELTLSLLEVMQNMELRSQQSAQVAVTGDKLYQKLNPNLLMFQNSYSSDGWIGDIRAYKIDEVTGAVDTTAPEWSAAAKLQSRTWDDRIIATYTGSAGIPFQYGSLTAAQKSQLDANYLVNSTKAQDLVKFLRGDASKEVQNGGTFRHRFARLGDIVHSAPVFSHGILYAGSNDGLLHAFSAESGEELFGYAPNLVFSRLKELAGTSYAHRYYVDLTPTVSDVNVAGITTLLVGGLGKGGRGYFALNVSGMTPTNSPSSENSLAQKVLWEYPRTGTTSREIADMGYSFSRANIVRSNDPTAPWIVIFGNGYDSSNGHAVLYILRADTGELLKRIDTGVGSCNGLSATTVVDVNYDNKADYVYAGDLKGNLWKFDLTSANYDQWGVAYSSSGTPKPLFQTPGQPITTKPNVMYHCTKHGYMVLFGTGRYLIEGDIIDSSSQAVYGIWDYGDDADDGEYVGTLAAGALTGTNLPNTVSLLQQAVVDDRTVDGMRLRTTAALAANWKTTSTTGGSSSGGACGDNAGTQGCDPNNTGNKPDPLRHAGWYLNLPGARERVISDVIVRSGVLTVVSHAPSNSLCGGSGESWLMAVDACSGSRMFKVFFDINHDGAIDAADLVNIGTPENPIMVVPSGINYEGRIQPPAYMIMPNGTENLYMSSSRSKIETLRERSAKLGVTYWRVMH